MKSVLLMMVTLLALCGCEKDKPVLHLYTWSDYIKPELVQQFEAEQGCRVVMDFFDSNEAMFAKLKAGATGYDLIFPSSYMVAIMQQQNMLQPLDHNRLPNLKHIDPVYLRFTEDEAMHHSVPYMVSNAGIGYLKSRVADFEPSWTMFGRADLAGRMTLLNDMRETLGAALKTLGYSLNTVNEQELTEARDLVIAWKRNIAKFETDQYKNGLVSAEFLLVHGYNGDIQQTMEENEDIGYALPREGGSIASDDMVIPQGAQQVELAHAFIDFIHRPEVAAQNIAYVYFLSPNLAAYALLPDEVRADPTIFVPQELLGKCEPIRDLGADNALYSKIWDQIKAAD
ncbi:ABC transporter substrate-binding protein [Desulfuromonas thiophila]|uniref:ABC transporter substrate-binding protein n=1 Tax=Desulfuromonas thiophila TaxID=57664 RepID=UPI0024A90E25|nr:spermidine/putrescine ABC transporter substrate-binding protein [Desulfuromonas thiophila]